MKPRVQLEPELEAIAALWPAAKRLEVARKLKRWSRQLRVSARIMLGDAALGDRRTRPQSVPALPLRKAARN
jgi:hypothetical protein